MSNIESKLATAQKRRDQQPNKELASEIVSQEDRETLLLLKQILKEPPSTDILFDSLKTLEQVGELRPDLVGNFFDDISSKLNHKAKKIKWMSISALSQIAHLNPEKTYQTLPNILALITEAKSVIVRDKAFKITLSLYGKKPAEMEPLLNEQILDAPDNQLGQYVEKWMSVIHMEHLDILGRTMTIRYEQLHNPSHIKRMQKNLKKFSKLSNDLSK